MNEAIRIAEKMLTEADGLMYRAKKIIEAEEEKKRIKRDEMDALCSMVYPWQKSAYQNMRDEINRVAYAETVKSMLCSAPTMIVSADFLSKHMFTPSNFSAPKVPNPEQKTVEVKRHAKVGERIKIVSPQYDYKVARDDYGIGDVFTAIKSASTQGITVVGKRDKLCYVRDSEYVVLPLFVPDPDPKPEVGMWVKRKYDGKMLCIISISNNNSNDIYVADKDGHSFKPRNSVSAPDQRWRFLDGIEYTIVPNYAPTPADMLEVIQ